MSEWRSVRGAARLLGVRIYLLAKRLAAPAYEAITGRRALTFLTQRFGHLAVEPDLYIKERTLNPRGGRKDLIVVSSRHVCNPTLWNYWQPLLEAHAEVRVFDQASPGARERAIRFAAQHPDYVVAMGETAAAASIQRAWGHRGPLLQVTAEDRIRGERALRDLGIPDGEWFVCLHNREAGEMPGEHHHDYRNADIRAYREAAEVVAQRGGWCIRLGDARSAPVNLGPRVIDYAHSPLKSAWLDVYLCATARCYVGGSSGLSNVAAIFGKTCGMANQAPISVVLPYGPNDVGVPKVYWSESKGRLLTFRESFASPVANARDTGDFLAAGISLVDNTTDEIAALASEVLEISAGAVVYSAEDERRQTAFKALMRPGDYSYGSISRVGSAFLAKYEHLLS